MRFDLKVALRYLLSNRLQSALLIGGVAVAVTVFEAWRQNGFAGASPAPGLPAQA